MDKLSEKFSSVQAYAEYLEYIISLQAKEIDRLVKVIHEQRSSIQKNIQTIS